MLDLGQYQIVGSTAREIATSTEAAIRDGALKSGDPLPTVRYLAATLGTSPATVNAAYRILRERGLVVAAGRRGTRVSPRPPVRVPPLTAGRGGTRSRGLASGVRDLTIGLADPALLLPVETALTRIDLARKLRVESLESPDLELLDVAAESFAADGVRAQALTVASGAFDALERMLQAHLRPGDRVIIEDPAYPSIRDLILALGLVCVPVPVDELGLLPEPFEAALQRGVEAVVAVPRAQNPFGSAMDANRAATLRGSLGGHPDVLVAEDDHAGLVSGAPFSTLVAPDRARWAIIRSVSKVLHPDLRLAIAAGDEETIARVEGRQALGPRWVSHILQALVAQLLRDPNFGASTARAQEAYGSRRGVLIDALEQYGIGAHGRSGLNVWVPVREEAPVVQALLDAGWLVLAGERFRIATAPGVRITISTLRQDEAREIAGVIAGAEHSGRPRRLY